MTKATIAGIEFETGTSMEACHKVIAYGNSRFPCHVHLVNAYTIAIADKNAHYYQVLQEGINFPDGKPISWFSNLFRQKPKLAQVRGPQLFLDVLDQGRAAGLKHFFLGDTPETLAKMQKALLEQYKGLLIAGVHSPPFRQLTDEELVTQDRLIKESGADLIWVGLGTPKQDFEALRLAKQTQIPAIAVGAAFAFTANTIKHAPSWITNMGLEWLFRLSTEPKRLWRRYFFGNARFLLSVIRRPHS